MNTDEESQEGRVLKRRIVSGFERLNILFGARQQRLLNERVEAVVDEGDVRLERLLPLHQRPHAQGFVAKNGHLPVREEEEGAMLGFLHQTIDGIDDTCMSYEEEDTLYNHTPASDHRRHR